MGVGTEQGQFFMSLKFHIFMLFGQCCSRYLSLRFN